jgi:hypothetical protein
MHPGKRLVGKVAIESRTRDGSSSADVLPA